MKNITLILALFATFFFTNCNYVYYYQPAETQPENTALTYNHGLPNLTGNTGECEITAEVLTRGCSDFLDLGLYFRNLTDSSLTFLPEEVRAYGFDAQGRRHSLRVFSSKEYIRHRNTRNAVIVGTLVAVAVASAVAINSAESGNNNEGNNINNIWLPASPVIIAPIPAPFAPHDGLLRQHTMLVNEGLAGNIKVRKNPKFDKKLLIEVPVNGRYIKFVYDDKERRW